MDCKYERGGDAGSKGVRFQVNLLTLFLLKAMHTLKNWRISTENKEAGKFDDAVLECPDGVILLQAKHRATPRDNKNIITLEDLLSLNTSKDNFSLPKYFLSYQEIKCQFKIKNVIICTNANFDKKTFAFLNSRKVSPESLLYCEEDSCLLYTFNDNILPDLKNHAKIYLQQCKNKKIDEATINDENLKDFLQHLQFYFNYPSGQGMENIIERHLSVLRGINNFYEEASSIDIHSKMMDWFQQKDGVYLTEINAKAMFLEIQRDKYWQKLNRYDVFFQYNDLNFDSPTKIFYIIADEGPLLREIQVYRILQDIKTVLCVRPESDVEELKEVLKAFELPKYTFIIVIWPRVMEKSLIQEVTSKLEQILSKKNYKKVIFVTGNSNELSIQFELQKLNYKVIRRSITFDDLSEKTKKNLLKKRIINFQGSTFSLEELFFPETTEDFGAALNSEVLEKLIWSEEVTVGCQVHPLDPDIEALYISRTFMCNDEQIEEGDIFEVNEKVILIAEGPGMGKSTVLTNLAISLKKKHPQLWVVKLILSNYSKYFNNLKSGNEEKINLAELLLKNHFEQMLFSRTGRVVLLLDGVDEISPNYTEIVKNLIIQCEQRLNFVKIFVTSRPHLTEQLENKLKVKSLKLRSFTTQNQIDFLTNYWARNLGLDETNKAKCEGYAKVLLSQMWFSENQYYMGENHFASIPLHLKMVAEIFQECTRAEDSLIWQGCKEYLASKEKVPNLPKQIDYAKFFKMFFAKKRGVYLEKVNPSGNAMSDLLIQKHFDECLQYHRAQALEVILDKEKCKLFRNYKKNDDLESEICNIGIIQKTDNGINFIHRTFAEYFFAECLIQELQKRNVEFQEFLIDEILQSKRYFVVRTFFDSFLQEVVDSLPSNIFTEYEKFTFKVNEHPYYLIHDLAGEGFVGILQLLLKSIDFDVIRPTDLNKEFTPFGKRGIYDIVGKIKDTRNYKNTLSILRFCVQQGGVNIRDDYDKTPLLLATVSGHLQMVKFLVQQGANVNCNRSLSQGLVVPLYRAVLNGYLDIVKFLVERGANIKPNSEWGYIMLYKAILVDYVNIVKYLLEKILEVDESATEDSFVPYTAAYLGRLDILEPLLREGADAIDRIPNGETLLFGAARGGQLNTVRYLVDHGADVNSRDEKGNITLHIISKSPSLNLTAKLFIELGIDINVGNFYYNDTPLHKAAAEGNLDAVQLFIEHGANVNAENRSGRNALHCAVERGHLIVVKFLIQSGANIDMEVGSDMNMLDAAAANGNLDIAKYLLKARNNVDVNFKSHGGYRALRVATEKRRSDIVKFLLEFGVDVNAKNTEKPPLLHYAVETIQLDLVRLFIKHGIDLNATDKNGNTALHVAVDKTDLYICKHIVKLLLDSGVNVNVRNKNGHTALHALLNTSKSDCLLLVKELDVDTYDEGLEAMDEGAMVEQWNVKDCKLNHNDKWHLAGCICTIIMLIKRGTDINLKDSCGSTVASLIKEKGGQGGQLFIKYLNLKLPE